MLIKNQQQAIAIDEQAIAAKAYELWQARGCPEGDGQDDWQEAKTQLLAETSSRRGPLLRLLSRLRPKAAAV